MRIPLTLRRLAPCPTVSFAVPLPPLTTSGLVVRAGDTAIPCQLAPLLWWRDAQGNALHVKSMLVQFDAAHMPADVLAITVETTGVLPDAATIVPFVEVSRPVTHTVPVADYALQRDAAGLYTVPPSNVRDLALFETREPCTVAQFAPGYLTSTGLFGPLLSAQDVASDPALAGVRYLSDAFAPCVRSGLYLEDYPVAASAITLPLPVEGFLYDRVATILLALAHTGDERFLRPAYRYAWAYQAGIVLDGRAGGPPANLRGYWNGKGSWDAKYSHARGLFLYYALTGDDGALAAIRAIGDLWAGDLYFSVPYQQGKIRGRDKLWTERLLGTAFEGCYYSFSATGEAAHLDAFQALLQTAYRHITTQDQAELDAIMQPWTELKPDGSSVTHRFPPQNAWIHNASQASEGSMTEPWCSGWMIELVLDPLLQYQWQTHDPRVDEIFARLGRFLRDTGLSYHVYAGFCDDTFLAPKVAYTTPESRHAVAMYGAGRRMDGARFNQAEYSDMEHAPDTTGMTAAALRALTRAPALDEGPMGPFASEWACDLAMHHEVSARAKSWLANILTGWIYTDPRLPAGTFHAQGRIAASTGNDPARFAEYVKTYGLGNPRIKIGPQRKLSWWFNGSLLQYGVLREAGATVDRLIVGWVQPGDVPPPPPPPPPPNEPPRIEIGGPYAVEAGTPLSLQADVSDPDDQDLAVTWVFGDGSTGVGRACVVTYQQPGTYTVSATVHDPHGAHASDATTVTVTPPPPPPPTYEELEALVARLTEHLNMAAREIEALKADQADDHATIDRLTAATLALDARIDALAAKITAAKAALEAE